MAVTSAVSAIGHARAGRIRWRTGLIFGAAGMAGAYVGGLIGPYLPEALLMATFAVMILATAAAMIRDRRTQAVASPQRDLPVPHVIGEGIGVGVVTGLVGAGGGFLVVPALVLLGGRHLRRPGGRQPVAQGVRLVRPRYGSLCPRPAGAACTAPQRLRGRGRARPAPAPQEPREEITGRL